MSSLISAVKGYNAISDLRRTVLGEHLHFSGLLSSFNLEIFCSGANCQLELCMTCWWSQTVSMDGYERVVRTFIRGLDQNFSLESVMAPIPSQRM
jgi:hypothetical protein